MDAPSAQTCAFAAAAASRIRDQKSAEAAARARVIGSSVDDMTRVARGMRLVLHGSTALREWIGAELDAAPSDMDFFSAAGSEKKSAYAFKGLMEKAGVAGLRCHPAVHPGTYTVRRDGVVIADITRVSPKDMECLNRVARAEGGRSSGRDSGRDSGRGNSGRGRGRGGAGRGRGEDRRDLLHTVPVAYAKMSMHLELTRPAVYVERWAKVFPRLNAVYRARPGCGSKRLAPALARVRATRLGNEAAVRACRERPALFTVAGRAAARAILLLARADVARAEPEAAGEPAEPDEPDEPEAEPEESEPEESKPDEPEPEESKPDEPEAEPEESEPEESEPEESKPDEAEAEPDEAEPDDYLDDLVVPDLEPARAAFPGDWEWREEAQTLFFGARAYGRPPGAEAPAVCLIRGVKNLSRNFCDRRGVHFGTSDLVLQYMYAEHLENGGASRAPDLMEALAALQAETGADIGAGRGDVLTDRLVTFAVLPGA